MISPADEEVRAGPAGGPGESVSFSWADADGAFCGSARVGIASGSPPSVSGLALLFRGSDAVALAASPAEVRDRVDWRSLQAGPVSVETIEPLRRWRAALDSDEGGFDLEFAAWGPAVELRRDESPAAELAGVEGYEHPCSVSGTVRTGRQTVEISALGQRGRQWGDADWTKIELARSVAAWFEPDRSIVLSAVRPREGNGHGDEAVSADVIEPAGEASDGEPAAVPIAEPRLSTVYDGEGRQRRAGMELWRDEEDGFARRVAGEAICGTSVPLGRLRLDAAFFRWRMEGRVGVGRYDVLRRA